MSIYGFININPLVDNTNAVVHPLGELSSYSESASIEKSRFSDAGNYPGIELVTFRNRGRVGNPVAEPPTFDEAKKVLEIAYWAWQQTFTGYSNENKAEFLQTFTARFGATVTNQVVGEMVTDGAYWLPDYIRYQPVTKDKDGKDVVGEPVKIWFSDPAFRKQYSQYDIAIIPPVANLDDLHTNKANVKDLVESRTSEELSALIASAAGKVPFTLVTAQTYDWIDKTDQTFKVPTSWWVLIWGPAGNNPDVIREELIDYILDNSQQPRSEWEKVLPDLFIGTEYIFVPNWDQYSLENQTMAAGLYSPSFNPQAAMTLMKRGAPTYADDHIKQYSRTASSAYKSLGFVVCGGARNRDGFHDFYEKWKQYIALPSTHVDFNRINPETREWMIKFAACLSHAESMTEQSEIPDGFARIKRNGIIYCEFTHEKVQYLVVTKTGLSPENVALITEAPDTGTWLRVVGGWVETTSAKDFIAQLGG